MPNSLAGARVHFDPIVQIQAGPRFVRWASFRMRRSCSSPGHADRGPAHPESWVRGSYTETSPARRRFVLAERVRGSYTGSAQSEERFGRNPCKKTRFSGALLSSENWLMQGEMAVPCCVLKRRLARGAALPCCVLKRSTGAIVRPRTCAKKSRCTG